MALPGPAPWVRFVRLVETAPGGVTLVAGSGAAYVGRPQGRFRLHAPGRNGRIYVVLGSLSGSKPGTPFPGNLVLPLNIDGFTLCLFAHYPKRGYDRFIGRPDPDGGGEPVIDWALAALDPPHRGVKLPFAASRPGAGGSGAVPTAVSGARRHLPCP